VENDFQRVAEDLRIEIIPDSSALTAVEQEYVEAIWQAESRKRGLPLFNGDLLEFVRLEGDRIIARFVEYKLYLASRAGGLATRRAVMPLGVSGLVRCGDYVGVGRRASYVTQYPGWLELFPSGGIDSNSLRTDGTIDHRDHIICELVEETGLDRADIAGITTFALVFDSTGRGYDICVAITLNEDDPTRLRHMSSDEYDELCFVSRGSLPDLMRGYEGRIVPTSRTILTGVGWL
jgi:hypothetical protein